MNRINALQGTFEYVPESIEVDGTDAADEISALVSEMLPTAQHSHVLERGGRNDNKNPLAGFMKLLSPKKSGGHDETPRRSSGENLLGGLVSGIGGGIGGILERLSPDKLEAEDLMLMLILYFLYRESGDTELLIIMAAMFLLE